jgi:hypothetical protein
MRPMQRERSVEVLHFRGAFSYDSADSLERALADAKAQLDEEDHPALASFRNLVRSGTRLIVDLVMPAIAEVRFAAAAIVQALATPAIAGGVEAFVGTRVVDFFPSGGDD